VDTWVRGQPHASDHAPTWIRLDLKKLGKPAAGKRAARKTTDKEKA
jgi:exodeoxyribonuclease-3